MSERNVAVCPECVSIAIKDTKDEALDVVESHNEQQHDGDGVAWFLGPHPEDLVEFSQFLREEYSRDHRKQVGELVVGADPWGVLDDD
jgi:hypothetical protein